ncbi:MAG: OmpA family protein [Treponema sp.]|nr:OmpA family protein [Treponema sp.]
MLKKIIFMLLLFLLIVCGVFAQTIYDFPAGDFWSLDSGFGMSDFLISGASFQAIIDPKLWLSPKLMIGSKLGVNFSAEDDKRHILAFEGLVYMRWNFLRLGQELNSWNIFVQGGMGLISAYRGTSSNPFNDVTMTRGSLLFDAAIGLTIPLSARWHLEPMIRGGYPFIFGGSLTAGYKFPLPQKVNTNRILQQSFPHRTEYVEVMKIIPPEEIVRRVMISSVEFVLFGPDIGRYNIGIDRDAQQLNEMVLNYTAQTLKDNPNYRVRIEGHANPYTINHSEIEELKVLSLMRANVVAGELKDRGVDENQIVLISFGGTRTATNEWDIRNRNRRVEMIITQVDIY